MRRGKISTWTGRRYLELVHIDIAVPMPVSLAGGKEYLYVVMDGYTHAIYTRGNLSAQ